MTSASPLFGVVGSPIAHSQSPALHRAAYAAIGFEARYDRTEVAEGGLGAFLGAAAAELRGLSVTMPLKREAYALAVERDRAAELTGAVNTLHRAQGEGPFAGANTDVGGIVDALHAGGSTSPAHVLVLGGGATATSAVAAASELGAASVTIAVRALDRAASVRAVARDVGLGVEVVSLDAVGTVPADVVISTLPGGTPLAALPRRARSGGALLLDAAYAPWPGDLVTSWFEADAPVVHGLSMLVHQAARQVRLFSGLGEREWTDVADQVTSAMFHVVGLEHSAHPDRAGRPSRP